MVFVSKIELAEKSVRPSEGMAEGGCGGNSAMPERIGLSPRHLPEYLEGRTPKKNVLSFLEEIGRAQIRKAGNIFLWCPPSPRGGGVGACRVSREKKCFNGGKEND